MVTVKQYKFIVTPLVNDHFRAVTSSKGARNNFAAGWVARGCLHSRMVPRSVTRGLAHVKGRRAARHAKHRASTPCRRRQAAVGKALTPETIRIIRDALTMLLFTSFQSNCWVWLAVSQDIKPQMGTWQKVTERSNV